MTFATAETLEVGDRWEGSATVVVHTVEKLPPNDYYPLGRIRISGPIIRGFGKGRKTRTWVLHPDQGLEVIRRG